MDSNFSVLSPALQAAARDAGLRSATEVQASSIAPILQGHDVFVCAPTGSGKTLAYVLPLLHSAAQGSHRNAKGAILAASLVLVPTRELAVQVGEVFKVLAQRLPYGVKVSVIFGGVSIQTQLRGLRGGTDIVVATPGRLLDIMAHNALPLSGVRTLVLDEADRMLDQGFADEVQAILGHIPLPCQRLFLSATFAPAVSGWAMALLQQPVRVDLRQAAAEQANIAQRAFAVDRDKRTRLLRHLMAGAQWNRVLVFVATQYAAEIVADKLRKAGLRAEPLHGHLSQGKRSQVLEDFKAARIRVVVATDLAARGIDVLQLPVVVNYDLPRSAQDYTHRIGRTGRAGESGLAISFVCPGTQPHWQLIVKRQSLLLSLETEPGFEASAPAPKAVPTGVPSVLAPHGGIKGKRPSKKDKLRAAAAQAVVA
jgi:ATP-dependent RNA helicase RhlE